LPAPRGVPINRAATVSVIGRHIEKEGQLD
jgi:hypothetical protein